MWINILFLALLFLCRVKQAISKKEEALGVLRTQHEVRLYSIRLVKRFRSMLEDACRRGATALRLAVLQAALKRAEHLEMLLDGQRRELLKK